MLNREDSSIDLSTIISQNKTVTELISLMVLPTPNIQSLTKDFLQSISVTLNKMVSESMKPNIVAANKNPEYKKCLEEHWQKFEEPHIQQEELLRTFSLKSF